MQALIRATSLFEFAAVPWSIEYRFKGGSNPLRLAVLVETDRMWIEINIDRERGKAIDIARELS